MKPSACITTLLFSLQEFSRHGNKNNNEVKDLAGRQADEYFKRKEHAVALTAAGDWGEAGVPKGIHSRCWRTGGNCRNVPSGIERHCAES